MSSKPASVVNVAANQPKKKRWLRHAFVVILLTLVALVTWMAYSSVIHRAV